MWTLLMLDAYLNNMNDIVSDMYAVSLTVYLIAKCAIAMVVTSVYVYTSELYPTKHRHTLFAYSSMMGRIGSMLAPLTPAFVSAILVCC